MDNLAPPPTPPALKRVLGLTSLTLYGLGTIIGAGIYVLVGAVAGHAGMAAPVSFLVAGVLAALTGLSYAELGQRMPEAAGAAAYAREGFQSAWMGRLTGFATLLVTLVAAASVARGGAGYLVQIVDVSLPLASGVVIVLFTALAIWGVKESVYLAAAMTVIEIFGLMIVMAVGGEALSDLPARLPEMWPGAMSDVTWDGVMAGTFLAFFAFAGFETIVNMAEETRDVERTLPRAVVLSILISAVLYMLVVTIAVLAVAPQTLAASTAPLCEVVDCERGVMAMFAPIAVIATLNGVLIDIVLMARVAYGMARRGWLPQALGRVHAVRRTPLTATLWVGAVVFVLTTSVEFEPLAQLTSALLLVIFFVVNGALIQMKRRDTDGAQGLRIPLWVPILGALSSVGLLAGEILHAAG
jgi:amino acid transporter